MMADQSKMDIGRIIERAMGMDDAAWARHASPWSGWTRVSILPLFALAVWSRVWLGWGALVPLALVLVWTWFNPRLFAEPKSLDNWMSQGVLGERVWLDRRDKSIAGHHQTAAKLLSIAAGLGVVVLGYGLWKLDIGFTIAGLTLAMGAKLWFLDRMVWLNNDTKKTKRTE